MPAVLLLVVGVLLAVGAPTAWALTHRDPALTPVGRGVAVALAESSAPPAAVQDEPTAPESDTLGAVPTATMPTAAVATPTVATPARPTPAGASDLGASAAGSSTRPPVSAPPARSTSRASAPKTGTSPATPVRPTGTPSVKSSPPTVAAAPVLPPVRLRIPAIGVDAPVGPVGVNGRGEMAIPQQVQDIGWYRFGPAPGAAQGSAVLSGHVDSAQQGLGAFSKLGDLTAGDVITVTDTGGRQLRYRVVGKEAFDKKTVPLADLFSRSGAARLTLITCGGAFDSAARSYLDNIVVTAVPA